MSNPKRWIRIPVVPGVLAVSAIMFCLPGVSAAQTLTGTQVLNRCETAYGKLNSYEGDVMSVSTTQMAGMPQLSRCMAHITFERPGRIRVDGKDIVMIRKGAAAFHDGASYAYVCNGTTTEFGLDGDWCRFKGPMMAIASATGIGTHSATTVPLLLLLPQYFKEWYRTTNPDKVSLESESYPIAGHSCYAVVVSSRNITTFYIDKKTWLLVRSVEDLFIRPTSFRGYSREHKTGHSGHMIITLDMKDPILNKQIATNAFALPKVTSTSPL